MRFNLGRDFLTIVRFYSTSFALAKVSRKIRDGRFKIRTSEPRIEVTWHFEGVRNDTWMQKYGAPVSVEKFGSARGKNQRPELYDAPPEMGMHWSPGSQEVRMGPGRAMAPPQWPTPGPS